MKIKKNTKKDTDRNRFIKKTDFKIVEGFYYDGLYGDECLNIHIQNKKTNKVYKGVLKK